MNKIDCEIKSVDHTREELFHSLGLTEEEIKELNERSEKQLLDGLGN